MTETPVLMDVRGLTRRFGGLVAVSNFEATIRQGELLGLIGPNGAGKTTCFNMLTGVLPPSEGSITFDGERIDGRRAWQFTQRGIGRTFQNIRLFKSMSVLDNVKVGSHYRCGYSWLRGFVHGPFFSKRERDIDDLAREMLQVFSLEKYAEETAVNLPYGEQRRLEIARALATHPKLLLLDEPAAGMNPKESHSLMELIHFIRDKFGLTIVLIEHDMKVVMGTCERILVLDYGQILAQGKPEEIRSNPKVIEAYLGKEAHGAA